jgi:hypothetical protein
MSGLGTSVNGGARRALIALTEGHVLGKVINLNQFRKRKAKADGQKQAEVKRRLHGRTKAERAREELQKQQLTRAVDGAKLEPESRRNGADDDGSDAG